MSVLLRPAELLLQGINGLRRSLYRHGLLRGVRLPRPVISVGNIAMGGAGKTPVTIAIARYLTERGLKVAVLTRGYGRADRAVSGVLDTLDAARWGDEPVLIKKRADKAAVIVGENRALNAHQYLASENVDAFLLDDGFQHLRLARDIDVVIDNPQARFHREARRALRDATFVLERKIALGDVTNLAGKRLFAFAALADNEQFFQSLRRAGLTLAGTRGFPDHHRYSRSDLDAIRLAARAADAEITVTTEKDAVKFDAGDIVAIPAQAEVDPRVLESIHDTIVRWNAAAQQRL